MKIEISYQFSEDFRKINDASLHQKLKSVIHDIKETELLEHLPYFKKIGGNDNAFKMAIGFYFLILYRTGASEYILMRCLSRDQVLKFQLK